MNSDVRILELKSLLPRCLLRDWVRLGSRLVRLLRDRHHADAHDALLGRLLDQARASVALCESRRQNVPRPAYPPELPITARHADIVAAIRAHSVIVVAGETGSGKTTQLPKMCLEAGLGIEGKIGCTQPRRVAALSISRRIAEELGVSWGREVGCKIRFDDRSSPETYIKLMTDGILLAETQGDPQLSEYNALIIDEAHERSLNIDFLLGHLRGLVRQRPDLKLIITSATIDLEAFSQAFDRAPVIEVSGRLFPVDISYAPLDSAQEESGDLTYIDAAVRVTERILYTSADGDVLIFMPGERDIRETADQLAARHGSDVEIIPLYGRLSAGEQQRVFAPGGQRKIVVATNIAETSLTIPGIRYVVDSGLARVSRYSPRTRTRRLPVEPIAQSSANQRAGRAGRVQDGVCIRLYSEEDFAERPAFTQPEIQRANLAEVILRMKAFHLGDIETFPFLNPPSPAAIQSGYALLRELGALDELRELTELGRSLARLPIDPTLGRMLLQSQREHATRELLIIAAGLSIQDPRERPLDQQTAADAAHQRHVHGQSDFLTLLNVWNAVHDEWESLRTQNQRRKFCKANFLSYLRMREWQDLHAQLSDALEELGTVRLNESNAAYEAVHRSVLSGLLAHIGTREDRNVYKSAGNRPVMVFPGSALFERMQKTPKPRHGRGGPERAEPRLKSHQPAWIMAGEIVETTQVFARTVAGIDPLWVVELGAHLTKVTHQHPHWSAEAGRVLVEETTTLFGLELERRKIAFGNVNPAEATALFIRSALVEEDLLPPARGRGYAEEDVVVDDRRAGKADLRPRLQRLALHEVGGAGAAAAGGARTEAGEWPPQYQFMAHNQRVRQKIEDWQTRVRRHDVGDLDQALFDFYARQLHGANVSGRDELNRWLRTPGAGATLCAKDADLCGGRDLSFDVEAFPDAIVVGGQPVAVRYAYAPGEDYDGVTVRIPFTMAQAVSPAVLEWAVPGLREAKAEELLRGLPKSWRTQLLPIAPKAAEIARDFRPTGVSLVHDLAQFIRDRYGVGVPASAWAADVLPAHLRARVEVIDHQQKAIAADRDLTQLRARLAEVKVAAPKDSNAWQHAADRWERFQVTQWSFGELPERVTIAEGPGLPLYGWPGLEADGEVVNVRLHRAQAAAEAGNLAGLQRLVEIALQKEMAWLRKDLRGLARWAIHYAALGTAEELEETAFLHVRRHILPGARLSQPNEAGFSAAVATARERFPGLASQLIQRVGLILEQRSEIARRIGLVQVAVAGARPGAVTTSGAARVVKDFSQLGQLNFAPRVAAKPPARPGSVATPATPAASARLGEAELAALLPRGFLESIPFDRLNHLPRYLKALTIRLERAGVNLPKDRERARQVLPYLEALRALEPGSTSPQRRAEWEALRWLIEEFRVSLFAQELGTSVPVSAKRLDEQVQRVKALP